MADISPTGVSAVPVRLKRLALCSAALSLAMLAWAYLCSPKLAELPGDTGIITITSGTSVPDLPGVPIRLMAELAFSAPPSSPGGALLESWRGDSGFGVYLSSSGVVTAEVGVYDGARGRGRLALVCSGEGKPASVRNIRLLLDHDTAVLFSEGKPCAGTRDFILFFGGGRISGAAPPGGKLSRAVVGYDSTKVSRWLIVLGRLVRPVALLAFLCSLYSVFTAFGLRRAKFWLVPLGLAALVFGAGTFFDFSVNPEKGRYCELASSFAHGHLHMPSAVPDEMMHVRDPYQYGYAWKYGIWDLSLYNGRFYMYFGPVSAVARLLLLNLPTEQFMVLLYGFLWAGGFILCCVSLARLCGRRPGPFVLLAGLLGGMNPLLIYLINMPTLYNEAALSSSAAGVLAMAFFLRVLEGGGLAQAALSGFFFGLAFLARPVAAFAFLPCAFVLLLFPVGMSAATVRRAVSFLAPFAAVGVVCLAYNYARFGNVFEFGVSYQITAVRDIIAAGKFFSPSYVPGHLYDYLLRIPLFHLSFPFVRGSMQNGLLAEPAVFSVFLWCPVSLFFPAALWGGPRRVRLFAAAAAASSFLVLLTLSSNAGVSARFIMDFSAGLSLAGMATLVDIHGRRPAAAWALLGLLAIFSAYMALGMGFTVMRIVAPARFAAAAHLLGLL